ncbi:DJ-1 family protein [Opitutaceae bacterium TAV4]|uniref:DJ-1 family glyoxalase III n=1 Tax=Geminisphaera colitermitum TaxID=1148786 RepID=UPI000B496A37|nr:DJ-1 family glyoxalase III [Geminisphaera colitermitum]RRJ97545.1 DJ-1 family protein [Opitutaceae bacterium TAV4]RRK01920.1 DJ-1 family protein [Opitutaceae bacterium TAV3]
MPTVLAILPEGFEELEAVAPIDVLRRAGAQVTLASDTDNLRVTGRNQLTLQADFPLSFVSETLYDLLLIPGGPGVKNLRANTRVRECVLRHHQHHKWIAAICAAPTVLADAGLLTGRRYTAHPSVASELTCLLPDQRVVVDGNIITSRGAGTALDFGLKLVEVLFNPYAAQEIARSICA